MFFVLSDHVSHTRAESFEGGAIVLLHPLVSILDEEADCCGSPVELVNLEPLNHVPVSSCGSDEFYFYFSDFSTCEEDIVNLL